MSAAALHPGRSRSCSHAIRSVGKTGRVSASGFPSLSMPLERARRLESLFRLGRTSLTQVSQILGTGWRISPSVITEVASCLGGVHSDVCNLGGG
jgi:hypothetical protein